VLLSYGRDAIGEQMAREARPLIQQLGLLPLDRYIIIHSGVSAASRRATLTHRVSSFIRSEMDGCSTAAASERTCFGAPFIPGRLRHPLRLVTVKPRGRRLWSKAHQVACDGIIDTSRRHGAVARRLGIRRRPSMRRWRPRMLQTEADDEDGTLTVQGSAEDW